MKTLVHRTIALVLMLAAYPALAWGPKTQQAIVSTAAGMLSKQGVVQLTKLSKDIQEGVRGSEAEMAALYDGLSTGRVRTIESEMALLETVKGAGVDPYFAYRLGALGAAVARVAAPLAGETPLYRDEYYRDVDRHLQDIALEMAARKTVDPEPYFARLKQIAAARGELIAKDYQQGIGFDGVARASLNDDFARSANAVADVWNTILLGKAIHARVSDTQIRAYLVGAFAYYTTRKNAPQIDATYRKLDQLTTKTPGMAEQIGDLFYEAGYFDRAIREYREVLAAHPQQKDVLEKITAYYLKIGDEALKAQRFEKAREAYAAAAAVDPLHPAAEAKRLEVETVLEDREARLVQAQENIETAKNLENEAAQYARRGKYAEALAMLAAADQNYLSVSEEFPAEFQAATAGLTDISAKISELKDDFIENAQHLSGATFEYEMQRRAAQAAPELDPKALKKIAQAQHAAALDQLRQYYETLFRNR